MEKTPIDMGLVFKRSLCLSDNREDTDNGYGYYNVAMEAINKNYKSSIIKEAVMNLINDSSSRLSSAKNYKRCIDLFEALYNTNRYDILDEAVPQFTNNVLAYCQTPISEVNAYAMGHNIGNVNLDRITSAEKKYKVCDRILENHHRISKRFNLSELNKYTTLDEISNNICELVDTYNIKPHAKMEICFEELLYLADKQNLKFREQDMVESVVDYFLSIPNFDKNLYVKAIMESPVLHMGADKKVKFLTESAINAEKFTPGKFNKEAFKEFSYILEDYNEDKIAKLINDYKMDTNKTDSKFKQTLNKIFTQNPQAILDSTPDILSWTRNFGVIFMTALSAPAGIVSLIANGFLHNSLSRDEMKRLIKYFENERDHVQDRSFRTTNPATIARLNAYSNALDDAINKFNDYNDNLYSSYEDRDEDEESVDEAVYTLNEIAKDDNHIIVNNLISDSMEADKFIDKLGKQTLEKYLAKSKPEIKDTIDESAIVHNADCHGRLSVTLCSYDLSKCKDRASIYNICESIVTSANNMLSNRNSKVYYTMIENDLDFILRSKYKVVLSLDEEAIINKYFYGVDAYRGNYIKESASVLNELSSLKPNNIIPSAIRSIGKKNLGPDQVYNFIEAWSYGAAVDRDDMDVFIDEYCKYQTECSNYFDAHNVKYVYGNIKYNPNADIHTVVEATRIMNNIVLNEGFDLNSLKLAMMDFKKKVRDFSNKEQEMARDLDATVNHFVRSAQNAAESERRDQIIRGDVLPSFSKCIKIGVGLAAEGVATGGVIAPIITAFLGLAMSKKASDKDRKMYIDEIDIDLQVLEREIRRCEDSGKSPKKYRQLLIQQKNLQRARQRLVIGLAQKGVKVTPSTLGLSSGGED